MDVTIPVWLLIGQAVFDVFVLLALMFHSHPIYFRGRW